MDVANEILDAIEIIVDKKIRENTAQIYPGICKSISGNTCVMSVNGKNNTVQFYGSTPTVGTIYRVFVPNGNMSMAFIITGTNDGSGGSSGVTSYTKLTDLPTINGVVLQEGATSKSLSLYGIGNEPNYPVTKVNGKTGEVILTADDVDALPSSATIVNPNLLDNWYFGNPVNQRGQTSYSANGYTIDRWRTDHNTSYGTLTVDKTTGCVTLSHADDGGFVDFVQYLENPPTEIVTLSVLMLSGNLYSATGTLGNISLDADEIFIRSGESNSVVLRCKTGKTISMIAAKLELGSQQTLAHQDADRNWVLNEIPDYGEQLARCQRYFQTFATESLRPTNALDFRPVMRATPALSTITVGGKTLYTASADL